MKRILKSTMPCAVVMLAAGCNWFSFGAKDSGSSDDTEGDTATEIGTIESLQIAGPSSGLKASTCLKLTVTGLDSEGTAILSDADITLTFSDTTGASKTGTFYSDSGCTQTLTDNQATIAASTGSAEIYYKTLHVTTAVVAVTAPDLETTTWTQALSTAATLLDIDMTAEPPNGDGTHTANNCYGPYYIKPKDASGSAVRVNSDAATTVTFSEILGGNGSFYGAMDTNCSGAQATNATIPAGSTQTQAVYYKGSTDSAIEFNITALSLSGNLFFDH